MTLQKQFHVIDNVLIIRLKGELDHHEAEKLKSEWQQKMLEHSIYQVVINLEELIFMDSSGIGVILGRYKEIISNGGELIICAAPPMIEKILLMSGMFKIIRNVATENNALDVLGVVS